MKKVETKCGKKAMVGITNYQFDALTSNVHKYLLENVTMPSDYFDMNQEEYACFGFIEHIGLSYCVEDFMSRGKDRTMIKPAKQFYILTPSKNKNIVKETSWDEIRKNRRCWYFLLLSSDLPKKYKIVCVGSRLLVSVKDYKGTFQIGECQLVKSDRLPEIPVVDVLQKNQEEETLLTNDSSLPLQNEEEKEEEEKKERKISKKKKKKIADDEDEKEKEKESPTKMTTSSKITADLNSSEFYVLEETHLPFVCASFISQCAFLIEKSGNLKREVKIVTLVSRNSNDEDVFELGIPELEAHFTAPVLSNVICNKIRTTKVSITRGNNNMQGFERKEIFVPLQCQLKHLYCKTVFDGDDYNYKINMMVSLIMKTADTLVIPVLVHTLVDIVLFLGTPDTITLEDFKKATDLILVTLSASARIQQRDFAEEAGRLGAGSAQKIENDIKHMVVARDVFVNEATSLIAKRVIPWLSEQIKSKKSKEESEHGASELLDSTSELSDSYWNCFESSPSTTMSRLFSRALVYMIRNKQDFDRHSIVYDSVSELLEILNL